MGSTKARHAKSSSKMLLCGTGEHERKSSLSVSDDTKGNGSSSTSTGGYSSSTALQVSRPRSRSALARECILVADHIRKGWSPVTRIRSPYASPNEFDSTSSAPVPAAEYKVSTVSLRCFYSTIQ